MANNTRTAPKAPCDVPIRSAELASGAIGIEPRSVFDAIIACSLSVARSHRFAKWRRDRRYRAKQAPGGTLPRRGRPPLGSL
jgi:hypothetical protein